MVILNAKGGMTSHTACSLDKATTQLPQLEAKLVLGHGGRSSRNLSYRAIGSSRNPETPGCGKDKDTKKKAQA